MEETQWVTSDMYSSKFVQFVTEAATIENSYDDTTQQIIITPVDEIISNYEFQEQKSETTDEPVTTTTTINNVYNINDVITTAETETTATTINNDDGIQVEINKDDNCEVFYILPHHKCNICNIVFMVVDELCDHYTEQHINMIPYKDQCLICGQIFTSSSILTNHMYELHDGINPYRCKYCARRFANRDMLQLHYKHLHDNQINPYECDICGRSYSTLVDVQNHKIEKHKLNINCPYCVKCFDKSNELKTHLNVHVYPEKQIEKNVLDFDVIELRDPITNTYIKLKNSKIYDKQKYCFVCGKFLSSESEFDEHLQTHSNDEFFQCLECNDLFSDFNEFERHLKCHTKLIIIDKRLSLSDDASKAYSIPKIHCGFVTPPRSNTPTLEGVGNDNNTSNTNNKPSPERICVLCKEIFRNMESYDNHMKRHKESTVLRNAGPLGTISWRNKPINKPYPYYCKKCKKYFVLATTLLLHNKTVHNDMKPYKCSECSMGYAQSSELYQHYESHPNAKLFVCKLCGLKFSKHSNLRLHSGQHIKLKRSNQYKCYYCGSDCADENRLNDHLQKHIGDNVYECEFCEIPFTHMADLNLHICRVHNVNPQRWQCRICHAECTSATEIMKHNQIVHFGKKPYKCDQCNKSFALLHSLVNHKVIHSGRKDYRCEYCGKGFSYGSYLKMHIRIHTGERPYICPYCPKTFSRQANLYEHKKLHLYDTLTPYTCEVCGKGYKTLSSFNKHRRIHTGIKLFKCEICSKSYVQKSHLDRHRYSHSDSYVFMCAVCGKKYKSPFTLQGHERKVHCLFKSKNKYKEMIKNVETAKSTVNEQENEMEKNQEEEGGGNENDDDDFDEDFSDYETSGDEEEAEADEDKNATDTVKCANNENNDF